jgi:hypothetical protein
MPDRGEARSVLEKRMAAPAAVFNAAFTLGHARHAMAEQAAEIADALLEASGLAIWVVSIAEQQRVPAPDADILATPMPIRERYVGVVPQEARQCVPDTRQRPVPCQVRRAASAATVNVVDGGDAIVDMMTP